MFRVLAAVLAIGLICHLLCSAGKKSNSTGRRRKFVKSSVLEKKDEVGHEENS